MEVAPAPVSAALKAASQSLQRIWAVGLVRGASNRWKPGEVLAPPAEAQRAEVQRAEVRRWPARAQAPSAVKAEVELERPAEVLRLLAAVSCASG